jgi:hypothetical protein
MNNYPDNFDVVSQKVDMQGFDSLSPAEQVVYCIWWLEGEVNNGGFHQFFFNSSEDFYSETSAALLRIGATKTNDLLETACRLAFAGSPSKDNTARQSALDSRGDKLVDDLYELDRRFYEYEEDLPQLVNQYIGADGT